MEVSTDVCCIFRAGCCTDLTKTGGAHIGAIAKFHNESSRLTVSSMVTQGILQALCRSPVQGSPGSSSIPFGTAKYT